MKLTTKIKKIILVITAFIGMSSMSTKAAHAELPYVPGTQTKSIATFVNDTDIEKPGFIPYFATTSKIGALIASANSTYFSCGEHVTYTRVLKRFGTRWIWMNVNVFDGYNITVNVPAHSTVTVTESLILPTTIPGIICLK